MDITPRKIIPKSTSEQIIEQIQYHGSQRAYDLHKSLRISRVAVHKQLRKLLVQGKLKKIGKPPLVEYVLSNNSMNNDLRLKKIKDMILPILKQAHAKRAALFGSYVKGVNTKKSDIDILVDLPDKATLLDLVGIKQDLEEKLKREVDVVEYEGIHPLIKESVMKNQYPIL